MAFSTWFGILIRSARAISTYAAMASLGALLLLPAPAQAAGPVLKSQGPCTQNVYGVCLTFTRSNLPPKVIRALDFSAPSAGQALVSAMGSGHCRTYSIINSVRFATQIVNNPNAYATYGGPGGNRFRFTLPAHDISNGDHYGTTPFNLASERVFAISAPGVQHYSLNISVPAMEDFVICEVDSVALTVLFLPK